MGIAGEFGFSGILSHWQIWIPMGALFQFASAVLNKYAKGAELNVPRILTLPSFPARLRKTAVEEHKIRSR